MADDDLDVGDDAFGEDEEAVDDLDEGFGIDDEAVVVTEVADAEDFDDDDEDEDFDDDEDEEEELDVVDPLDELLEDDEEDELDELLEGDDEVVPLDEDGARDRARRKPEVIGVGEFTCRSCFLVRRRSALADAERMLCVDCV